jgi:hypothetical protein
VFNSANLFYFNIFSQISFYIGLNSNLELLYHSDEVIRDLAYVQRRLIFVMFC